MVGLLVLVKQQQLTEIDSIHLEGHPEQKSTLAYYTHNTQITSQENELYSEPTLSVQML